ncbi:hypothetical protein AT05_07245 [Schleiferia thermophila str. Yellowstone]|nr:hypothetical protein AT05_07245 [Schleiferia thermophila str. Yellowstone]
MNAVRKLLLWTALSIVQLHAAIPHFHSNTLHQHDAVILTDPNRENTTLLSVLEKIFSFDQGKDHLEEFTKNNSLLFFVFTPFFSDKNHSFNPRYLFQDNKLRYWHHFHYFNAGIFSSKSFRGPPLSK